MSQTRPTICLNMIVRNEAHVVSDMLLGVSDLIDYWVVVDTGSDDGTQDVIRSFFAERGVPGELHERPWRHFGHNRTEALQLAAGKAEYTWVIDADDLIVGTPDLTELVSDSYELRFGSEFVYWRSQIFRSSLNWAYEGVVHEYPHCLDQSPTQARLEGEYYIDSRRLGSRNQVADKYERDIELLQQSLTERPDDARSVFYLAQSQLDAGQLEAALASYARRAAMGGWAEEIFYSLLQRGRCLARLERPWAETMEAYLECWQSRPSRAEPLYEIARHYRTASQFELGYLFASRAVDIPFPDADRLFVDRSIYDYKAHDELAVCAFYTARYQESFDLSSALLASPALPERERGRLEGNRDLSVPHIKDATLSYPLAVVHALSQPGREVDAAEVTFTIAAGGPVGLFEHTVNSFLNCCTDLHRIGRWICIGEHSAETDREYLAARYPFFEFVPEPASAAGAGAGAARRLNRLLELIETPFWLHLEDRWHFFATADYVSTAVAILDADTDLGQVVFNRNYAESIADRWIAGGLVYRTSDGIRFVAHDYDPTRTGEADETATLPLNATRTNAQWPHFSLRPSLIRTAALQESGPFHETSESFEFELAHTYTDLGWRTAFFDSISATSLTELRSGQAQGVDRWGDIQLNIEVINLDRRPDRWATFRELATAAAGTAFVDRCHRRSAIDGKELTLTPDLERRFRGNDFGFRRGVIGCALSHLEVWREVANGDSACLVLEDDVRLGDAFTGQLVEFLGRLDAECPEFELAFLGWFVHGVVSDGQPLPTRRAASVSALDWTSYAGGTFAYLLSPPGARRLVELADSEGMQRAVDWFIADHAASLTAVCSEPPLAFSKVSHRPDIDSDIQWDSDVIS